MNEVEKWIEDLYNKCFYLDRKSVREFIGIELRNSPMEKIYNSMNVIQGVIELNSAYSDLYLIEVINYRKELRELEKSEKK